MVSRLRSWLQQIKQRRGAIGVFAIALMLVIALIIAGYWFDWTGFNGYTQVTIAHTTSGPSAGTVVRTEVYQPGKALWDWLNLLGVLAIPAVVGLGVAWYTAQQRKVSDRENTDNQRETALQTYINKMSELLLEKHLRESQPEDEVRTIARVRTITILFQLDARRIGYVFAFLREAGLVSNKPNSNIVSLSEADLSKINLSQAFLSEADLSYAKLSYADLSKANLSRANLSRANLDQANLSGANLWETDLDQANLDRANLSGAYLREANLSGATFREANLNGANLGRADLRYATLIEANLSGAILAGANLSGAHLLGADLRYADLDGADLSGAVLEGAEGITIEELEKQAYSLAGATMPDGSKHA